jgi:hypothetical protein
VYFDWSGFLYSSVREIAGAPVSQISNVIPQIFQYKYLRNRQNRIIKLFCVT